MTPAERHENAHACWRLAVACKRWELLKRRYRIARPGERMQAWRELRGHATMMLEEGL